MRVELLGPVRVDGDVDAVSPRDRIVLTALAIGEGETTSIDRLSQALWRDDAPASGRKIVQGCISRLRRRLGDAAITTMPDGYALTLPSDEVDVRRFEHLLSRGRELLALGDADRAAHTLGEAVALWRGTALSALDDWPEGLVERQRLARLRDDAEELRVAAVLDAGRPREAIGPAARLLHAEHLREARWCLLARAQYQCGHRAAALETLQRARAVLADELGLDPGPALESLQTMILQQDESLAVGDAPLASERCPYPGLVPFGEADGEDFFGRDEEIAAALSRLDEEGVLVVVGASGSGKSSLVRAGVAAHLRAAGRSLRVVLPGDGAAARLDAVETGAVVVLDQVESLLGPELSDADADRVRRTLAAHALRGGLVMTVRADRLVEVARGPLAPLVERGLFVLGPMDGPALRRAIEEPAARSGLLVEPGLVALLVEELEDEPGALPLLAHVLRSTWERRESRTLTVAGYQDAGGVRGAIAKTAEEVHASLTGEDGERLRELLLRLVVRDDDGSLVGAPVPRRLLTADPSLAHVVDRLVAARLLTLDEEHVHLAHEALVRAWPRLQRWLGESAETQRTLRHLTVAATSWDAMGRPDSELYRGVRLVEIGAWRERSAPHLSPVEAAFLDRAVEREDAERHEAVARVVRTDRANARLRRALAGVAVLTVLAVVGATVATAQSRLAERAASAADARRLSSQALTTDDVDTALLLAVEAVARDASPDTQANLLATLERNPALVGVMRPPGAGELGTVAISADGEVLATYDETNTLRFHDLATRTLLQEIRYIDDAMDTVVDSGGTAELVTGRAAFHPGGGPIGVAVATLGNRPVRLLDAATLDEAPSQPDGFPPGDLLPWDLAWSPDGALLAAVVARYDSDRAEAVPDAALVIVWDVARLSEPRVFTVDRGSHSLAWSPDSATLFTGTDRRALEEDPSPATTAWDVATGEALRTYTGVAHPIALTADGRTLVGATPDGRGDVAMVDTTTGIAGPRATGRGATVSDVAVSSDGRTIAVAAIDGTVGLHETSDGRRRATFDGHAGAVAGVGVTPDGSRLVSVGADRAALLWDLGANDRLVALVATSSTAPRRGISLAPDPFALVSPDGARVAYLSHRLNESGTRHVMLQFLDVASGELTDAASIVGVGIASAVWLPDGTLATLASPRYRLWDPATGQLVADRQIGGNRKLGVAGESGTVVLVSAEGAYVERLPPSGSDAFARPQVVTGLEPGTRIAVEREPDLAVTGDGTRVATFGGEFPRDAQFGLVQPPSDILLLLNTDDGTVERSVDLGFDGLAAAYSPDESRIAVVGRQGRLALVDVLAGTVRRPSGGDHAGDVVSVVWLADGALVATGGHDGRVALWDGSSGAPLGSVQVARPGSAAFVGAVADDRVVLAATSDGEVYALDTRLDHWVATACAIAGRALTTDEWRDALGDQPYRATCAQR